MKLKFWISTGLSLSLAGLAPALQAATPKENFGLDVRITGQSEDDRDLGTREGGDVRGIGLDLRPWLYGERGDWNGYVMGQAVTASDLIESGTLESDNQDAGATADDDSRGQEKHYLALREAWISYNGLTQYPGEYLRVGRQRIRTDDGTWWNTNIEAVRWNFDTTLLRSQVGVAERFSDYRTDLDELRGEDDERLHVFGDVATQWQPGHWVGLRAHHVNDRGNLPADGAITDATSRRSVDKLTWLGLNVDGDFFNRRSDAAINYWGQVIWLTGDREIRNPENARGPGVPNQVVDGNVNAWGADLGLRWNIDQNWRVGAAYAYGSGDDSADESGKFMQTGLQGNRSNFTGTRAGIHRFGEAFRGEMNNLHAATLFAAWTHDAGYDASLVYHRFWRADANDQSTGDNGLSPLVDQVPGVAFRAPLERGEKDLGQEIDLVVSRYFRTGFLPSSWDWAADPAALVRLRAGVFFPGDAYGSQADSTMHRAFVDVVWRY